MILDAAFHKLYENLPRQGVSTDSCTREAIRRLPPLRSPPAIIDIGCGSGRQTILLASHFQTVVDAIDDCRKAIEQLKETAIAAGIDGWVRPRQQTLVKMPELTGSFDLVWCESAARTVGMAIALSLWAPLLRRRGVMVVSECSWTQPDPPEGAITFWRRHHPGMMDATAVRQQAKNHGLRVFDCFVLPRSVWRTEYVEPLTRRVAELKGGGEIDATITRAEAEIEMFERWGDRFQYGLYLLRRA